MDSRGPVPGRCCALWKAAGVVSGRICILGAGLAGLSSHSFTKANAHQTDLPGQTLASPLTGCSVLGQVI